MSHYEAKQIIKHQTYTIFILGIALIVIMLGMVLQAVNDRVVIDQRAASRTEVEASLANTLDACKGSDQVDCHIEYWYDEQGYATGGEVISRDPEE